MIFRGEDTRAEKRYTFRMPIECAYDIEECDSRSYGPLKTFTTDISRAGLGIYSECPAREGQIIKIFLKHVYKEPILAEVRWCRQDMDDLYKIGIRYLGSSPMGFFPQA